MMNTEQQLLADIEAFCARQKMAPSTFGQKAVRNWQFVERLRSGHGVTMRVAERARKFMESTPVNDTAGPHPERRTA